MHNSKASVRQTCERLNRVSSFDAIHEGEPGTSTSDRWMDARRHSFNLSHESLSNSKPAMNL